MVRVGLSHIRFVFHRYLYVLTFFSQYVIYFYNLK